VDLSSEVDGRYDSPIRITNRLPPTSLALIPEMPQVADDCQQKTEHTEGSEALQEIKASRAKGMEQSGHRDPPKAW